MNKSYVDGLNELLPSFTPKYDEVRIRLLMVIDKVENDLADLENAVANCIRAGDFDSAWGCVNDTNAKYGGQVTISSSDLQKCFSYKGIILPYVQKRAAEEFIPEKEVISLVRSNLPEEHSFSKDALYSVMLLLGCKKEGEGFVKGKN